MRKVATESVEFPDDEQIAFSAGAEDIAFADVPNSD